MARRRVYALPITSLVDSELALTLHPAAYGALVRLAVHFWQSGCRPLPPGERELRQIARAHNVTWKANRAAIMSTLAEWQTEMRERRALIDRGLAGLTIARATARGNERRKAALERVADPPPAFATGVIPKREAPATRPPPPDRRPPRTRMTDRPQPGA